MADNVQKLREAGCIPQGAQLSEAEVKVIEGLSDEELQVLIDIREKLRVEMAKSSGTAEGGESATLGGPEVGVEPAPNFII